MSNLFDIRGKTILITGGVHGLGRMIAEGMLRAGAKVYVTSRKADAAAAAETELRQLGDCVALAADLVNAEATVALANEIKSREPRLHAVINNAGKTWGAPLEQFPDKAWNPIFAVNVQGPFTLVRELLPLLQAAGSEDDPSRVINIGSLAGSVVERIDAFSYSASKAAIHHLSRVLAAELAERHITVNAVVPGYFPTQMTAHIRSDEDQTHELLERIPLARLGHADDIAGLCIFLCSRAGRYMTGAELYVDGGMSGCR
ncbi:SDR family oxidoreductase [Steroidobacter flavus]|uniref:SDR family oxidoreductase n=1 Tax=Steroidobacter flavus TaxID=1842136 RepID=A0ABV8T1T9_9GAMM